LCMVMTCVSHFHQFKLPSAASATRRAYAFWGRIGSRARIWEQKKGDGLHDEKMMCTSDLK
jgi:hypothetical protein